MVRIVSKRLSSLMMLLTLVIMSFKIHIDKVKVSISCDDHPDILCSSSCDIIATLETNHARKQDLGGEVESLKSCVAWLTKGEYKHKEILIKNTMYVEKRALGSYPNPTEVVESLELKVASLRRLAHIVNIVGSPAIIQWSVLFCNITKFLFWNVIIFLAKLPYF